MMTATRRRPCQPRRNDFTIILLWSRIGTRLPPSVARDDGRAYESGTEWEFEDARRAGKDAFVYVRRDPPPSAVAARCDAAEQLEKRDRFLDSFRNADGSLSGFIYEYSNPPGLEDLFEKHMVGVIRRYVERAERSRTMGQLAALAGVVLVGLGGFVVRDLRARTLIDNAERPEISFTRADTCSFAAAENKRKGFLKIDYAVTKAGAKASVYLAMAADEAFSRPYLRHHLESRAENALWVDFPLTGPVGDVRESWARIEVDDGPNETVVSPAVRLTCAVEWQ
jgi:hypothetical protein